VAIGELRKKEYRIMVQMTIELERELGWPDGERVAVTIEHAVTTDTGPVPGVEPWAGRLVFDSAILPTERIVKGARLPAEMLLAELEMGRSDERMLEAHPELTREDLAGVVYAC
jgi:hypothetical protein